MSCQATLNFAISGGAHLSFYWTMNEGGTADRLDSTVGNAWPLIYSGAATPGLFSNGVSCTAPVVLNQNPGLNVNSDPAITITQAVSKGLSVWFWIKYTSYGTAAGINGWYFLDTPDPLHTNRFRMLFGNSNASGASIEVGHTNDTQDFFADSPSVAVPLGVWQMYAMTYDKVSQTLNGYVNGVLACSTADPGTYPDLASGFMQLVNSDSTLSATNFIVDELGLCLNGPLTAAQVTALYNGGAGVTWPTVTSIVPYP